MLSPEQLKDLYGEQYVETFKQNQALFRLRIEKLVPFIEVDEAYHVIDFGCGDGLLMPFIAPKVKSYTGIDFSEAFIGVANERRQLLSVENVAFICDDIIEFCSQKPNYFDVGFALDFSEHVHDEVWLQILTSMRHSLKAKGRLYLHTPNGDFFLEKMKAKNFIVKQFPEHIAVRGVSENVAMMEKAGFQVLQVRLIPHYNALRFLHPLSYLPWLGKYFKARVFIEAAA